MYMFLLYTASTYKYYTPVSVAMLHCVGVKLCRRETKNRMVKTPGKTENDGSVLTDGLRSQAVPVISLSCRSNFFTLIRPTRTCSPKNAQREYAIVAGPCNG